MPRLPGTGDPRECAEKWALLITDGPGRDTLRFSGLKDGIGGAGHELLTGNPRTLERHGPSERIVHRTVPPRVEYALTQPGQALGEMDHGLCGRTEGYLGHIEFTIERSLTARRSESA